MPKKIDISGNKYGDWLVIGRLVGSIWQCRCSCGAEVAVAGNMLTLGKSTRCKACASKKHGMEGSKIYNIWAGMKQRCQNPAHNSFERYGGRGIKVCEAWQKFEGFYADMGDPPEGHSLGRIDNDGDYDPSNVRWETPKQQIRNRSITKHYEYDGRKVTLGELADEKGMPVKILRTRIAAGGMSLEKAIAMPYNPRK